MTNPFADITDPTTLRAMVQDGVKCKHVDWVDIASADCPTCNGTGHTPLSNADLDALAACWCEGWKYFPSLRPGSICTWRSFDSDNFPGWHYSPPAYTTSPDAAMRLQVKYHIIACHDTVEELCHTITTAALVAALSTPR